MIVKLFWNFDIKLRPELEKWVLHEGAYAPSSRTRHQATCLITQLQIR